MKLSIKVKSSIFLAGLLLLTVSILSITVLRGIQENQQRTHEEILAKQSRVANLYLKQNYLITFAERPSLTFKQFIKEEGEKMAADLGTMTSMHVVIYDEKGEERGNSYPSASPLDLSDVLKLVSNEKAAYQIIDDSLYYLAPLPDFDSQSGRQSDEQAGIIQFAYPLKDSIDFYNTIQTLFYEIGTIIFIVSFLIGYLYFSRLTGGISKLEQAVEQIQRG